MAKKSTSKLFDEEFINEPVVEDTTENVSEDTEEVKKADTKVVSMPAKNNKSKAPVDDIQDIDLSIIKKKKFRINGDSSKILELNVSDMGISTRLHEAYPRLEKLMNEVSDRFSNIPNEEELDEESLAVISEAVADIDKKMREEIDFIFNSNVSEICGSDGSMWDPIEGSFRYEHIIESLSKLYENNLSNEYEKMKRRVSEKTAKYTKRNHK